LNKSIAKYKGYQGDNLAGAIRYLEKKYKNPSDIITPEMGGGLQHHLRDFSHHLSPYGLLCSVVTQFTREGYGTDTDGKFIHPVIPENDAIGSNLKEKIIYGTLNWFFHLVSDMAGSSGSAGAGTGIPGPVLSIMKEASALPLVRDIKANYDGEQIAIAKWISKLFNGTAFPHDGLKDVVHLDLRTEIGIGAHLTKESVPVIINQGLVYGFYVIKHLIIEIKNKSIQSVKDLKRLEKHNFLDVDNRCYTRMCTIASGVFLALDTSDAVIRKTIKKLKSKPTFAAGVYFRINFAGVAYFMLSLKKDMKYIVSDVKAAVGMKEKLRRIALEHWSAAQLIWRSRWTTVEYTNIHSIVCITM
jgi:hypothetical protein